MKIKNVSPATHFLSELKPGDVCNSGEKRGVVMVCRPHSSTRLTVVSLETGQIHDVGDIRVRPLKAHLEVEVVGCETSDDEGED